MAADVQNDHLDEFYLVNVKIQTCRSETVYEKSDVISVRWSRIVDLLNSTELSRSHSSKNILGS